MWFFKSLKGHEQLIFQVFPCAAFCCPNKYSRYVHIPPSARCRTIVILANSVVRYWENGPTVLYKLLYRDCNTLRSAKQPIMLSADLGYYLSGIKVISWFLRDFQSNVSPTWNISALCYIIFIIEWLRSDWEMLWHSGPDQQTFTGSVVQ